MLWLWVRADRSKLMPFKTTNITEVERFVLCASSLKPRRVWRIRKSRAPDQTVRLRGQRDTGGCSGDVIFVQCVVGYMKIRTVDKNAHTGNGAFTTSPAFVER